MTEAVIHRGAGASDVPRGGGDTESALSAVSPHEPLPAVELVGISKIFGSTVAAKNVSFELFPGEVLALVGENGAGKSTLVKTVGGVYRPDEGFLRVAGERVELHSPLDAQHRGIAVVHQHPGLFPDLSIAENVFAGQPIRGAAGLLDHGRMRAEAQKWIDVLGLRRDAGALVSSLRTSEQQMVEIARALAADAKVLILDEPTAALTIGEVEKLFAVIDELRTRGVAMMFVGHRMEEIFAVSDRIAILRDGALIDTRITAQTDQAETVKLMVGRALGDLYPKTPGDHRRPGPHGREPLGGRVFLRRRVHRPGR